MKSSITPATSGQIRQIGRLGSAAIEKVLDELALDKSGAQRVIHHGGELAEAIRVAALASLRDLSIDKFEDEEVASNYGYPVEYCMKGIPEQVVCLRELFPGIGFADESVALGELPKHAEGWFAIPKWQTVAPTYNGAVEKVLAMINQTRGGKFQNYCEGQLGPDQLRQSAKSASAFQRLAESQKDHDILVVPAQFGLRHRGRSVRRACEVFDSNEFGLGAFAIGIMILTHPERLMYYDDLYVDCAGDEFKDPGSSVLFGRVPYFGFGGDEVEFDTDGVSDVDDSDGSASAFLPAGM